MHWPAPLHVPPLTQRLLHAVLAAALPALIQFPLPSHAPAIHELKLIGQSVGGVAGTFVPPWHVPFWQVWPVTQGFWLQDAPFGFEGPATQFPFPSQNPP